MEEEDFNYPFLPCQFLILASFSGSTNQKSFRTLTEELLFVLSKAILASAIEVKRPSRIIGPFTSSLGKISLSFLRLHPSRKGSSSVHNRTFGDPFATTAPCRPAFSRTLRAVEILTCITPPFTDLMVLSHLSAHKFIYELEGRRSKSIDKHVSLLAAITPRPFPKTIERQAASSSLSLLKPTDLLLSMFFC